MDRKTDTIKSQRVLVYGQIPPPHHGSNIMTEIFIKALKGLGHKVVLSDKMYSNTLEEVNKVTPVKFFRFLAALSRYVQHLRHFRPDLVVFFVSATRIGLLAEALFTSLNRFFRIPFVHYIHANGHKQIYSKGGIGRALVRSVFFGSEACLVVGRYFKDQINNFYKGKIHILPNCLLDPLCLSEERKNQTCHILYLSNLYKAKGIFTLIKSIPEVIAQNKNVIFLIAGPWPGNSIKKEVLNYIDKNELQKYIQFLGPIYREEKERLFQKSDIFVFPSQYPLEAFGLVNLEAMQAGIPVITTNIGAMPEMVIDGKTGFIIPPQSPKILAEKICKLIANPDLRKKLGKEGKKRFEKQYTFQAYSSNVDQIFGDLFNGS